MKYLATVFILFAGLYNTTAQIVPSEFEHIEYLVTFGEDGNRAWGDDDHVQTFFFVIPKTFTAPVYIRVFDPETGGTLDEANGAFDTKTRFSVYAGRGAHSHPDARRIDPTGNFKSGQLLYSKVFGNESKYNEQWHTFGPLNPLEGEESEKLAGYVFKIVAEGLEGNDGNLYRYFLSVNPDNNKEVEGSNAFTYEYSFRLPESRKIVTHLYPFIDDRVVSFTQHNFDYDNEGDVFIYSIAKNRHEGTASANLNWAKSKHFVTDEEKNTTVDIQLVKRKDSRNDMVMYLKNQYDEAIAFFSTPIGGPPKFKYKVDINYHPKSQNGN